MTSSSWHVLQIQDSRTRFSPQPSAQRQTLFSTLRHVTPTCGVKSPTQAMTGRSLPGHQLQPLPVRDKFFADARRRVVRVTKWGSIALTAGGGGRPWRQRAERSKLAPPTPHHQRQASQRIPGWRWEKRNHRNPRYSHRELKKKWKQGNIHSF